LQKIIDAREQVAKALNMNSLALEANNRAMDARTRATEEMAKEIETLRREIENAERQGGFNDERVRGKLDEILKRLDAVLTRGLT
jgi:uncharacterized protein Yka (UPF0111/DUF47 family)